MKNTFELPESLIKGISEPNESKGVPKAFVDTRGMTAKQKKDA